MWKSNVFMTSAVMFLLHILPNLPLVCDVDWHNFMFFAQRSAETSVTITTNNGGKIARESRTICEKLRLGLWTPSPLQSLKCQYI